MENTFYHIRWPLLIVTIFITHVPNCVLGATPMVYKYYTCSFHVFKYPSFYTKLSYNVLKCSVPQWCKIRVLNNLKNGGRLRFVDSAFPYSIHGCRWRFTSELAGYLHRRLTNMNKHLFHVGPPDKSVWFKNFVISHPKHMLWLLKRNVSMRRFFWAPIT